MLVVGNLVGSAGLAAISNAPMLCFIINSIGAGVTMGGTVLIAQYKGAGDLRGQTETIGTLFTLSAVSALLVSLAGLAVYQEVFRLLHIPEAAMNDACDYTFIICCGTVCVFGYNAVCAVMRGLGDAKSPLYFIAAATAVNLLLDLVLVGPLQIGTKGAAFATVLSQGFSFIFSVVHLKRRRFIFDFRPRSFAVQKEKLTAILAIGLPSAAQMILVNLSYLLVTGMLNLYGIDVAAASGIGLKVNTFAGMPCWAAGQAVTAMAGQNMGAGKTDRVRETVGAGLLLGLGATLAAVFAVQIFAGPVISLFEPDNPTVIEYGVLYLRICCSAGSLAYAVMYTFDSFAIGLGNASLAMFHSLLDAVVIRLSLSRLLGVTLGFGFTGIYFAQALSPVLPALLGFLYFRSSRWETRRMPLKSDEPGCRNGQ